MARVYNRTSEKSRRQLRGREMPKAEEVLWSKLRPRQMLCYKCRRQYSVAAYGVDFYCPSAGLAIEIDGDSHFQKESATRDETRQTAIESFGIPFLRFRNVGVFEHLDGVLTAIERHLLELKAKRTPLKSPLVQGGTFEATRNGETRWVPASAAWKPRASARDSGVRTFWCGVNACVHPPDGEGE